MSEAIHLRSDYFTAKTSEVAACGIVPPPDSCFGHPEDVTCGDCAPLAALA